MKNIVKLLKNKILFLDGAMGTMIQKQKLNEADFKGKRFKNWKKLLKGNNDILNITKPELIHKIHDTYFLVNLVDNDFLHGVNLFEMFEKLNVK